MVLNGDLLNLKLRRLHFLTINSLSSVYQLMYLSDWSSVSVCNSTMINEGNWTKWQCNLVWVQMHHIFQIEWERGASSIWIHKYDFRLKLHKTKFSYVTQWLLCLSLTWNLVGYFRQIFKYDWLFWRKTVSYVNKSHCWVPIRLQGLRNQILISKWIW